MTHKSQQLQLVSIMGSRRGNASCCLLLLLAELVLTGTALEYEGVPGQWTRYSRWDAKTTGQLSFILKTNVSKALVLYMDDGGNCDFLELLVEEGRLQMRFTIHCAEPASLHTETRVDDLRWHRILLSRDHRETRLAVDNEEKSAEVKSKRKDMVVASDLFVGGISPDVRLSALTSSTVKYEPPFQGFIANLKLGEALPVLLDGQAVHSDLEYICAAHSPCGSGGQCSVSQGEVICDCLTSSYRGRYCHEGKNDRCRLQQQLSQICAFTDAVKFFSMNIKAKPLNN